MEIRISNEPGFLRVLACGEFSLAEAKRTFLEALDAAEKAGTERVLFDGRQISGEPLTMERFYYSEFAAAAVWKWWEHCGLHFPRFAYVLLHPVLDWQRFGETVARNRGMPVKVFEKLEPAIEWLGEAQRAH